MRFVTSLLLLLGLLLVLALPGATQEATAPAVTVTPASGTTATSFVISGEGCISELVNWQVRFPAESTTRPEPWENTDVLVFGTARTVVEGRWESPPIVINDMIGPGEYIADAECLGVVDYAATTFTVSGATDTTTTTTPAQPSPTPPTNQTPAPAPKMTG